MRFLRYSNNCARYSVMLKTCSARALMLVMSRSAISVPMEISAASLRAASTDSSWRMSERSVSR